MPGIAGFLRMAHQRRLLVHQDRLPQDSPWRTAVPYLIGNSLNPSHCPPCAEHRSHALPAVFVERLVPIKEVVRGSALMETCTFDPVSVAASFFSKPPCNASRRDGSISPSLFRGIRRGVFLFLFRNRFISIDSYLWLYFIAGPTASQSPYLAFTNESLGLRLKHRDNFSATPSIRRETRKIPKYTPAQSLRSSSPRSEIPLESSKRSKSGGEPYSGELKECFPGGL